MILNTKQRNLGTELFLEPQKTQQQPVRSQSDYIPAARRHRARRSQPPDVAISDATDATAIGGFTPSTQQWQWWQWHEVFSRFGSSGWWLVGIPYPSEKD